LEKVLGHLDLLDRLGGARLSLRAGRVLDVGASDWAYAGALTSWLVERTSERPLEILGIEVDPHRFDLSLVTAASKARHQIELFSSEQAHLDYQGGNVLQVYGKFDLITWMFPVFTVDAVRKNGLATELFQPDEQLQHANRILDEGGYVLFMGAGYWEWEALQERIVALDLPWRLERVTEAREHLHSMNEPVYVSLWSKGSS
jgi:SAM-dependent methyltransferase